MLGHRSAAAVIVSGVVCVILPGVVSMLAATVRAVVVPGVTSVLALHASTLR